jgi:hypothetical protein
MKFETLISLVSTSIVKTGLLPSTSVYGRPEHLQFKEDTTSKGTSKDTPCKVYNVTKATAGADSFLSYICDYKAGEINYQVLGREANFCFTTIMNGCTFGIGSPTSDGSVLVSHANMAVPSVPTAETKALGPGLAPPGSQAERQLAVAKALHGPGASYLTPDVYRHEHANVTLFGGRTSSGAWKFYYQRWVLAGYPNIKLLSVNEVTTTKADF